MRSRSWLKPALFESESEFESGSGSTQKGKKKLKNTLNWGLANLKQGFWRKKMFTSSGVLIKLNTGSFRSVWTMEFLYSIVFIFLMIYTVFSRSPLWTIHSPRARRASTTTRRSPPWSLSHPGIVEDDIRYSVTRRSPPWRLSHPGIVEDNLRYSVTRRSPPWSLSHPGIVEDNLRYSVTRRSPPWSLSHPGIVEDNIRYSGTGVVVPNILFSKPDPEFWSNLVEEILFLNNFF